MLTQPTSALASPRNGPQSRQRSLDSHLHFNVYMLITSPQHTPEELHTIGGGGSASSSLVKRASPRATGAYIVRPLQKYLMSSPLNIVLKLHQAFHQVPIMETHSYAVIMLRCMLYFSVSGLTCIYKTSFTSYFDVARNLTPFLPLSRRSQTIDSSSLCMACWSESSMCEDVSVP